MKKKLKTILLLCSIFVILLSISYQPAYSFYTDSQADNSLNLSVESMDHRLMDGAAFCATLKQAGTYTDDYKIASVTFGYTKNYSNVVNGTLLSEPEDVSAAQNGTILLYRTGSASSQNVYILSDHEILANESCRYMFGQCYGITKIKFNNFNTKLTANMDCMFKYCQFSSIDLSSFNTSRVDSMAFLFEGNSALTSVNLESFNTKNLTNTQGMFCNNYNLKTIYVSDKWTMDNVTESTLMFHKCGNLVGGAGTIFDGTEDGARAIIDGGTDNPGYLTAA